MNEGSILAMYVRNSSYYDIPLDNKVKATIIAEHIEWRSYSRNVTPHIITSDNKVNAATLNYSDW